jgi:hypothetical protein
MGRGLRRTADKKRVQVLDFTNNIEHLLLVDRVWREVDRRIGVSEDDTEKVDIDVNTIHFNDEVKRLLPELRRLFDRVYDPAQNVPEGSVRLSALAVKCNATPATIRTIMKRLNIEPEVFPKKRGKDILYLRGEDAYRVDLALKSLFK